MDSEEQELYSNDLPPAVMSYDGELMHIGVLRRSGRYPWGSGKTPNQRNKAFLAYVEDLRKQGMTETEIAKGLGITTTALRANKQIARNQQKAADIARVQMLKDKGLSNVAIGEKMGINESVVRKLLDPAMKERNDILTTTSNMLRENVDGKGFIDIGAGVENHIGVSREKLSTAVAMLQEEGYTLHYVQVKQLGTGEMTTIKVLAPPNTTYSDVYKNQDKIKTIHEYSEDGGRSYLGLETPTNVSSKRVAVRYAEDGGGDADGVIQVRRGVDDVSLGGARYAQVRIAVDGTHYLKGMAVYSDDMPEGVDLVFNTNKSNKGDKLKAMKPMENDPDNPFGSVVRQRHYEDSKGNRKLSAMNIVNEEGDWYEWSKTLSSQMLSKQTPSLAKEQLELSYNLKKAEYDEIMALTNPTIKKHLLPKLADGADAAAVHLKAAGLPRTAQHVILPINSLKDNEIYAPQYRNGETVVLVRHPHGGIFEIPELKVNNKNPEANRIIKQAKDAVGINAKVAGRLSGADFDGDTVLVIPNNNRLVKTSPALKQLKNFDPQKAYPAYDGMPRMTPKAKQLQMGDVSNLITDMTIRGASQSEIARAVKHSMVVIDAEKHHLNYKQSAKDNQIAQLKKQYQGGARNGASTLISRASSEIKIDKRKARPAGEGGAIDAATGKKMWVADPKATYIDKNGKSVTRKEDTTRMAEVDNAFKLSSGSRMEAVYATHANKLKALGNQARKQALAVKPTPYDKSARVAYANEVNTLGAKLNVALKNKPRERQAQLLANAVVDAKRKAKPDMEADELKKIKGLALTEARVRTGASKTRIEILPREWDAIQAGAITTNKLNQILENTDLDKVKALATPRTNTVMSNAKMARAKNMLVSGYTQAEIADALGVPTSTLNSAIGR